MTIEKHLLALLERYCTNLADQVGRVGQFLSQSCCADAQSLAAITEAQIITHQIWGTGGSMGFPDVTSAASALDENLKRLIKQPYGISTSQLQVSIELFARLQKISSETTPEKSTLYHADLSQLRDSTCSGNHPVIN
jgi:hypothetical protein